MLYGVELEDYTTYEQIITSEQIADSSYEDTT